MATITGSTNNSKYTLTCEYSYTQNTTANTSTITAIVYLNGNGYSTTSSYWCCTINGTEVTTNWSGTVSGKTELGRRTWTVNHNSDGTASVTISFSFSNRVTAGTYTVSSGSGSSSVTLTTIPRASTISLNRTSAILGTDSVTITITRSSTSFTHRITFTFGSSSSTLTSSATTSYSFTPSISLCSQIPNATSGSGTIKVETLSGSTVIGSASKTITLTVPTSVVPSVGISVTANNTLSGTNISGVTTFTVKPSSAAGSYGSTIKSYAITGGYLNSTSSSGATTGTLGAGDYTFQVKVTDSRGRTATASQKVTVYAYSSPTVSMKVQRANSDGTANSNGTYISGTITFNVSNPNSKNANAKQYALYKKTKTATTWTTVTDFTTLSAYSGSLSVNFGSGFATTTSYNLRVSVKDTYNTTTYDVSISTISAVLNIEKNGVGVGKIWEQGALDVGGDGYISGGLTVDGSVRVGAGKFVYGTGNDGSILGLAYVNQTNNASEFGTSTLHTTLKSGDNPTWYSGNDGKAYNIWTDKDCVMSSNSNCQTWRFPNGMQVSIMKVSGTWNVTTAWGNVYSSPWIASQSFNIAFAEAPKVMINAYNDGDTSMMIVQCSAPTTTATGAVYLWKPTSQTGVKTYIEYIAIGRWK